MRRNCLLAVTLVVLVSTLPGLPLLAQRADDLSFQTWNQYLDGSETSQYASLVQIDRTNVDQLEVVWSYPTGDGNITFVPDRGRQCHVRPGGEPNTRGPGCRDRR